MLEVGTITGILGSLVAVGGVIITIIRTKNDRAAGISTADRETRRDTIADRDSLIDQLQENLAALTTRVSRIELEYDTERYWNRMLVDHIYKGLPPPPPKRPTNIVV